MQREHLADLDELVLRCRDNVARTHIEEALASYRAGAYRSCIVSTWIAVVYDYIHKLRDLDLSGDKLAKKKLKEFEDICKKHDVSGSLLFEKNVILQQHEDFELITPLERVDLERLFEDRNRCAHPSMNSPEETYAPTAELARLHLRNAVTHVLQRRPTQGKAVIDKLIAEIRSPYFPTNSQEAKDYLKRGPLGQPREALVRNWVIVILKGMLLDKDFQLQLSAALEASRALHRESVEATLKEQTSKIYRLISDKTLYRGLRFQALLADVWQYLEDDVTTRLELYIKNVPGRQLSTALGYALEIDALKSFALEKIESLSEEELGNCISTDANKGYLAKSLAFYFDSHSWNQANERAIKLVIPLAEFIELNDFEKILEEASDNGEISHSHRFIDLMQIIRETGTISERKFVNRVKKYGLEGRIE